MNTFISHMDGNGRVCIPSLMRKELGLIAGSPVVVSLSQGEVRISTYKAKLKQAQSVVGRYVGRDGSLSKDLKALRKMDLNDEEGRG